MLDLLSSDLFSSDLFSLDHSRIHLLFNRSLAFCFAVLLFPVLLFVVYPPEAIAQDQTVDSVYALPAIEVTGIRFQLAKELAPASVSLLSPEDIQATASQNLAQLLDRAGSPFVRQYGNGLNTLSFRGTSSSQTLITLDGVPLSDPQLGIVDLSLLSTSLIDEVQILHGPGSSLYGSQSIGGVINIQTRQSDAPFFIETSGMAGPFETREGRLAGGLSKGPIQALVAYTLNSEKGNFPFLNAALFPPQTTRREGSDRHQSSLFANLTFKHHNAVTRLTGWVQDTERGLPGPALSTSIGERQWDEMRRLQASHTVPLSSGVLLINGMQQWSSLRYMNPQIDVDQTGRHSYSHIEVDLSGIESRALPSFTWGLGSGVNRLKAMHPNLGEAPEEIQASLSIRGHHADARKEIYPSLRIDAFIPTFSKNLFTVNPGIGINVQPFAYDALRVKASTGRAFRSPTFNDRFWQPGGNPQLKPEHGWNYELGAIQSLRGTSSFEVLGFFRRIKNQITWLPSENPAIWSPQNIGITRTTGVEVLAAYARKLSSRFNFTSHLTYTLVHARDMTEKGQPAYNKPLRYTPRHMFKSRLGINRTGRNTRWNLNLIARQTSRRFVTTDGSQYLPPYFTTDINLGLTQKTGPGEFAAGLFLENLFNDQYEVIKGYPVPPRSLHVRLSLKISGEE